MRVRLRGPHGQHVIGASLEPSGPVSSLQAEIAAVTSIPPDAQVLRIGFPPRPLDTTAATLQAAGVTDGAQVTVELRTGAPAPTSAPAPEPAKPSNDEFVRIDDGFVTTRIMKDDNSCMFRSVAYLLEQDAEKQQAYREIVAQFVLAHPDEYNEVTLDKTPATYAAWIRQPGSWGGAIELSIFSRHFQIKIDSIDISTQRVDRFGSDQAFATHVLLFYSGIHYDAVVVTPFETGRRDCDQTQFEGAAAERALAGAQQLAATWHRKRKFTDLARFTLKCGQCGKGLTGQREAQEHALATGHQRFSEYS